MKTIYLISFLFIVYSAKAQNTDRLIVHAAYAIDSNSTCPINQLNKKKLLKTSTNTIINIGFNNNATVWCVLNLTNNSRDEVIKKWLCFDNNFIDSLVFYDNGTQTILGDMTTAISPFIQTQAFPIYLKPNEHKTYYVRVKKLSSYLAFSFSVENESQLIIQSKHKTILISFFMGMVFLLVIFNCILYFLAQKQLYLYYISYTIVNSFYLLITTYYAKFFIAPTFLHFSELRAYLAILSAVGLTLFIAAYLNLKQHQPLAYKTILYSNILNVILAVVASIVYAWGFVALIKLFFTTIYIAILIIISTVIYANLVHLKINRRKAVYVILAFAPYWFWVAGIILSSFRIITNHINEDWLVSICLYKILLFGFVLSKDYLETFQKNNDLIKEITLERENSLAAINQTQIRERRNLANILHDNIGSKIAYISQLLQLNSNKLAHDTIMDLANEVREISHKILPKSLDEGALLSSLQNQINSLNFGLKNTEIVLTSYDFPEKIDTPWIYDLYLMALEIINNAVKHGKAHNIEIDFYKHQNYYLFQFTDDGLGFDTNIVNKGFGLDNIEKRVLHYKGKFELNSSIDEGTVIQINLPLNQ